MKMDEISIFRVEDSPYLGLGFIFVLRMEISIILDKVILPQKKYCEQWALCGISKKKIEKI